MPQAEMLPDTIQPSADQSQGIMSVEGRLMEVLIQVLFRSLVLRHFCCH